MRTLAAVKFLALGLALAAVVACGVKTDPYPAEATLPGAVRDLGQFISDREELVLSWKAPAENMVGRELRSLGGFAIEMSDNVANEVYCATCPHRYTRVDQVPAMTPPPGLDLAPGPYQWRYTLTAGHVYRFRVYSVARNGGIHPDAMAVVTVWAIPAPAGLAAFDVALKDKAVEITWPRPSTGYRAEVERLENGQWRGIVDLDSAAGRYLDLDVAYENSYSYRGRLVSQKGETLAVGPWSPERAVRVADITPPNPPGYLDAALAGSGVRLSWESLAFDPDLAGYRVYRRVSGEEGFKRISGPLLSENTFFDPIKLNPEITAEYRVTSVDRSPAANESGPSPIAGLILEAPVTAEPRPE